VAAPAAHAAADVGSVTAFLDRTLGPGFVQAFSLIFVSELGDKVAKQKGGGYMGLIAPLSRVVTALVCQHTHLL
jgi:hypothetical protein